MPIQPNLRPNLTSLDQTGRVISVEYQVGGDNHSLVLPGQSEGQGWRVGQTEITERHKVVRLNQSALNSVHDSRRHTAGYCLLFSLQRSYCLFVFVSNKQLNIRYHFNVLWCEYLFSFNFFSTSALIFVSFTYGAYPFTNGSVGYAWTGVTSESVHLKTNLHLTITNNGTLYRMLKLRDKHSQYLIVNTNTRVNWTHFTNSPVHEVWTSRCIRYI